MAGGFRFLSLVQPFMSVLPEVAQAERKIPFRYALHPPSAGARLVHSSSLCWRQKSAGARALARPWAARDRLERPVAAGSAAGSRRRYAPDRKPASRLLSAQLRPGLPAEKTAAHYSRHHVHG
jgi:hypothetical protein